MSRENQLQRSSSCANSYSIASILNLAQSNSNRQAVGESRDCNTTEHSQPTEFSPSKEVPASNDTLKKKHCHGMCELAIMPNYYHSLNLKF